MSRNGVLTGWSGFEGGRLHEEATGAAAPLGQRTDEGVGTTVGAAVRTRGRPRRVICGPAPRRLAAIPFIMAGMSQSPAIPPAPPVEPDLLCHNCGYNLHTLAESARCPECGMPVSTTRRALALLGGIDGRLLWKGMLLLAGAAAWPLFVAIFRARLSVLTRPWAYLAVDGLFAAMLLVGIFLVERACLPMRGRRKWVSRVAAALGIAWAVTGLCWDLMEFSPLVRFVLWPVQDELPLIWVWMRIALMAVGTLFALNFARRARRRGLSAVLLLATVTWALVPLITTAQFMVDEAKIIRLQSIRRLVVAFLRLPVSLDALDAPFVHAVAIFVWAAVAFSAWRLDRQLRRLDR